MTLTRTSPASGAATVMVSRVKGCLAARATIALQVIGIGVDMVLVWGLGGFVARTSVV